MNAQDYDHNQLKKIRELKGLTQKQVAERLSVDRQTIYRAEAGASASYALLCRLCELYAIDVRPLLHSRLVTAA